MIGKLRPVVWLLLAVPAGLMFRALATGDARLFDLYHPTGELALRLMVVAMMVGPLIDIFGRSKFLLFWLGMRRNIGVAAFGYGALHLLFYILDMRALVPMLEELALPGIWTGWVSFACMLCAAAISTDWAMKALGIWWKRMQMAVYGAVLLGAVHWWLLDNDPGPALIHLAPLILVWTLRAIVKQMHRNRKKVVSA